jgi:glycosyltransferase involved in cell wall biosynthesis
VIDAVLVVLPTLGDRLDTLRDAFESVVAQRVDAEITLVVVAPSNATRARELALEYGAILIDDPKRGLAGAMNAGLASRKGEKYYLGLGDDDLLRPGSIRMLLQLMAVRDSNVVAYGACDYIDAESRLLGRNNAGPWAARILSWGPNLVPHPGTLIQLDALIASGGFDEGLPYTMDLDAFLSLKKRGTFASTRVPTAAFRWHADSLTVADRGRSTREARLVKQRHLPAALRVVSAVWLFPVQWATTTAGAVVSRRSRRIEADHARRAQTAEGVE